MSLMRKSESQVLQEFANDATEIDKIFNIILNMCIVNVLGIENNTFECGYGSEAVKWSQTFMSFPGVQEACEGMFHTLLPKEKIDGLRLKVAKKLKEKYKNLWCKPVTYNGISNYDLQKAYYAKLQYVIGEFAKKLAKKEVDALFEAVERNANEQENPKETRTPRESRGKERKSSKK